METVKYKKFFDGRVLFVDNDSIIACKSNNLFISYDRGDSYSLLTSLPCSFLEKLILKSSLLSRLFRKGVSFLDRADSGDYLIFFNKSTYRLKNNRLEFTGSIRGSRPLSVARKNGDFFYGEYRSNPERKPVSIFKLSKFDNVWKSVIQMDGVRHIHGVFYDIYTDSFWVTTGDSDGESGIYNSNDDFKTVDKVVGGAQIYRAVHLTFTEEYIFYGSDTPKEDNYICKLKRSDLKLERHQRVDNSVFYSRAFGNVICFSTAAEPSTVNSESHVQLWINKDEKYFSLSFKKDMFSMRYFQYGQIFFPSGPGDNQNIYFTNYAIEKHLTTFKVSIKDIV
ncbi:Glycosyl hydrolase BNR repeat-containing protein [Vibrio coralliirubri]|uniref:Glycosyl hydrolase BNR repeat-containing protein n=2 Tax=Vibrio coralliirubri TaxID=1516159 RepID=A0AA86XV77_9VIBR|nr:Glycosyl hydrolase BNR repeat-containing protein [Vibrio coralliirubri]